MKKNKQNWKRKPSIVINNAKDFESNRQELMKTVNTFSHATGIKFGIRVGQWTAMGVFMGMSDAIPGYSGGSSLAILGVYSKLVLIAKSVFSPEPGLTRKKAIIFMLPFVIGWMCGIFGFAKLTELIVIHGMGLELIFAFATFVAFSIPSFLKSENPQIFKKHIIKIRHLNYRRWIALAGFVGVLSLALWVSIGSGGAPFGGNGKDFDFQLTSRSTFKLLMVAVIAGMFGLMPGGSGAVIQLISGMYAEIHWGIMAHLFDNWHHFLGLVVFAGGTFGGMIIMVFIMTFLLKTHKVTLRALSFGMLLASVIAILIVPEHSIWHNINTLRHIFGIIAAIIIGASASLTIYFITNAKNQRGKHEKKFFRTRTNKKR